MRRPKLAYIPFIIMPSILLAACATNNQRTEDPLLSGPNSSSRQVGANTPAVSPRWNQSTAALAATSRPSLNPDTRLAIEDRDSQFLPPLRQTGLANNGATLPVVKERLGARGVNWEKVEAINGQFIYRCSVPDRQNPTSSKFYEAKAADELSARLAVLERMEKGL